MNQEFKEKWVAALRSGEHKQHRKMANDSYGRDKSDKRKVGEDVQARCCLNVGAYAVLGSQADTMGSIECFRALIGNEVMHVDNYTALIGMNDTLQWDFNKIADWVEENL